MFVDGEQDRIALAERHDLADRLLAGPLLDQQELAALEVALGLAQQHRRLQREDQLAVEIAVEAVVVLRAVAQQQRRRPELPAGVAFVEPGRERRWETPGQAERLVPEVGHRRQRWIERLAQPLHRLGQRIGEILVLTLAVAMMLHDDMFAKQALLRPQRRQRSALVGADQAGRHDMAALAEDFAIEHPDILTRAARFFYPWAA